MKNETVTSNICNILTVSSIDCGIALSYEQYKAYYKAKLGSLGHIKNYWITDYNKEFKEKDEEKVFLWKLEKQKKIDGNNYDIIRAREKK